MKKVLVLLAMILLSLSSHGQWDKRYYVDDFGEKTNKSYESLTAYGTFSNSASQNAEAMYLFIKGEESISVKVYEYKSNLANEIDHTFETVKIKSPSGEVSTIEDVFFTKQGTLYFSKDKFTELNSLISSPGKYIIVFNRSGKYSNSSYKIKFNIN